MACQPPRPRENHNAKWGQRCCYMVLCKQLIRCWGLLVKKPGRLLARKCSLTPNRCGPANGSRWLRRGGRIGFRLARSNRPACGWLWECGHTPARISLAASWRFPASVRWRRLSGKAMFDQVQLFRGCELGLHHTTLLGLCNTLLYLILHLILLVFLLSTIITICYSYLYLLISTIINIYYYYQLHLLPATLQTLVLLFLLNSLLCCHLYVSLWLHFTLCLINRYSLPIPSRFSMNFIEYS